MLILFVLLALDLAGFAHADLTANAAALIALVVAIVAVVLELRGRGTV
ncbi:MAG: hypothetical protein LC685_04400 [Actinobacteria bacterium]|nr:hypothetical protein [Actinomycetota bacterium]